MSIGQWDKYFGKGKPVADVEQPGSLESSLSVRLRRVAASGQDFDGLWEAIDMAEAKAIDLFCPVCQCKATFTRLNPQDLN